MEMLCRLNIMIGNKLIFILFALSSLVLNSCENNLPTGEETENSNKPNCTVSGYINAKGAQIVLTRVDNSNIEYVVISDANGNFIFDNIYSGEYYIDATRNGYVWNYMLVNGQYNFFTKEIEVKTGETIELRIILGITDEELTKFQYNITDINGYTIRDRIRIDKETQFITFKLYNESGRDAYWSVSGVESAYITDGRDIVYIFTSFSETSGVLLPGESKLLTGIINQNIFDFYYDRKEYILNYVPALRFGNGNGLVDPKRIELDLEFY